MINSSFQRSPPTLPSVSTQQPYSMCLLYSAFSCTIFLPYSLCTPFYFLWLFKRVMILMLLSLAAWKEERTGHDLLWLFLHNWDCDLGLGLREWAMHKTKKKSIPWSKVFAQSVIASHRESYFWNNSVVGSLHWDLAEMSKISGNITGWWALLKTCPQCFYLHEKVQTICV